MKALGPDVPGGLPQNLDGLGHGGAVDAWPAGA
jgi:hypothetical protein